MSAIPPICVAVLAHNEEARIPACLASLPLGDPEVAIHVIVNGSTDDTAVFAQAIAARADNVTVHEYRKGGKARSWNRFLFDDLAAFHRFHIFVDGDAEALPGSVAALAAMLEANPKANAAAGLPMNGRRVAVYQQQMRHEHGLFGDLYALPGSFLARMKDMAVRLPDDVVGDDGLICAMAKTDLADESHWDDTRVVVCEQAGFLCAPVRLASPLSWRMQYRRMINYSVRHFQNRMISIIMREAGPAGLPRSMTDIYPKMLPGLRPRRDMRFAWFDRIALARMARMISD